MRVSLAILVALAACDAGQKADPEPRPKPESKVEPKPKRVLDIKNVEARSKPRSLTRPSVTYKDTAVTIVGIELDMTGTSLGGAGGWWAADATFAAHRGGSSESFKLTWTHRDVIVELAVLGEGFEVSWNDNVEELTFTHLGKARGQGNQDCRNPIGREASQLGFETIANGIDSDATGVVNVALDNGEWIAHCGQQSHRVWFTRKEQPE
jgi:hypothetical protein